MAHGAQGQLAPRARACEASLMPNLDHRFVLGFLLGSFAAAGCSSDSNQACQPGAQGCPCLAGQCFAGLACEADVCVGGATASGETTLVASSEGGASDDMTASASGSTGLDTSESGGTTAGPPDLGPCEDYIACSMQETPEGIASIIATYGSEGSCWSLPGVSPEDCWTECTSKMAALAEQNREAAACWACDDDSNCSEPAPSCEPWAHECVSADAVGHCDDVSYTSTCDEGPASYVARTCSDSPGHCPAGALGVCRNFYPMSMEVTYFYDSGGQPWTEASAQAQCETGEGTWFPA